MRNESIKIKKQIKDKTELHLLISKAIGSLFSLGSKRTALQDKFIKESLEIANTTRNEIDSLNVKLHLANVFTVEEN